ncbi:DUF7666 domain-containing protein [Martelella lutilitoris]|uniref:DUF7666 domain-containing protein n=1 Tax=Martelella lutilitoris TaxID=2583532 RepID=UPI001FEECCCC|nr:hypothetical protein [Martelella lutilitoris]
MADKKEVVHAIKGFDSDMKCRGYQYEVGNTYEHDGPVVACESGFHSIEGHPLEVFCYYAPATSKFCDVIAEGEIARHSDDSKIASAKITIEAEIGLPVLVERAVKWVFDRAKWSEGTVATGDNEGAIAWGDQGAATASGRWGAATASGDQGAATASGRWGAATASGDQGAATASGRWGAATASGDQGAATASGRWGAATASGRWGAATASGDQGAATASGRWGAATASGDQGAATASGRWGAATASGRWGAATASGRWGAATASGDQGKARAKEGSAIFLVERNDDYEILNVFAGIAGRDGLKADTWYRLKDGKPVEVQS